jgi:hypothetical protein
MSDSSYPPSPSSLSRNNWQPLGELELVDSSIDTWLGTILSPLRLDTNFPKRVLLSANEAVARALQSDNRSMFQRIQVRVFVQTEHMSHGETWGFFRIEKVENVATEVSSLQYVIELYLYLEGA